MKTIFKPLFILLLLLAGTSLADAATVTPSKRYVTRKVTSGHFDAVRTNTALDIIYTVGPIDIEIYAPDNLMPYIQITKKGSEIIVNYKENMTIKSSHKSYVKISAPDVVNFTAASAGDIKIKSDIRQPGKTVKLLAHSAGDIEARNIEAENIEIRANSAGDIETGKLKARNVSLITNSAGDIESREIAATKEARIIANSSGGIDAAEIYAGANICLCTNSSGDLEIGVASAPNINLGTNSAGDIEVKSVKATNVIASTNSAGDIDLTGICSNLSLVAGSTGNIHAKGLKATNVSASARSVGNIECYAIKSLNAFRNGGGKIRYAGNPSEVIIDDKRNGGVSQI